MCKPLAAAILALMLVSAPSAVMHFAEAGSLQPSRFGKPCTGATSQAALACARRHCRTGWSIDIAKQTTDGKQWHEVTCGWSSKAEAKRAAGRACDRTGKPTLVGCNLERLLAPGGAEAQLDP